MASLPVLDSVVVAVAGAGPTRAITATDMASSKIMNARAASST